MPEAWNNKDERQYEHVLESETARGRGTKRAKEIAARTVNKQRRREHRVQDQNEPSRATGNPESPLSEHSVLELRNQARELHVRGYSHMRKDQLIDAIRAAS